MPVQIVGSEPWQVPQPPVISTGSTELTVAISSLSLGGAEQIVLDWALRVWPKWKVHLIVLRDRAVELPVPPFVHVTRLRGVGIVEKLTAIGEKLAFGPNPVCVCHLLNRKERDALTKGGALVVPVLHNAKAGWLEDGALVSNAPHVIAVSEDCARDLTDSGYRGTISVIRHIPRRRESPAGTREELRAQWHIPATATVIGMVGAIKPQKNYPMALRLLQQVLRQRDAYLVILGGPVNTSAGRPSWEQVVSQVHALGVRHRVAMPGFVPDAAKALCAFDMVLNTSFYEGLSIATLEALQAGLPVVAHRVGGQGELSADGLTLVSPDSPDEQWLSAINESLDRRPVVPPWTDFPAYRMWSLAGLARPVKPTGSVLFVTANLNAGGAQRSLVNLTSRLVGHVPLEVVVAGISTATSFCSQLMQSGVPVHCAGYRWDAFAYAETLVAHICENNIGTVVFWNTDARVKLLAAKALGWTGVRLVDVSPGDYLYGEMDDAASFQQLIAYSGSQYWRRLDALVLKHYGTVPDGFAGSVRVIPNGVPQPAVIKTDYRLPDVPRVVVSGRIAPTKFLLEIITAHRFVRRVMPQVELHIYGTAEHYHRAYGEQVTAFAGCGGDVVFHGADFGLPQQMAQFDAFVVLGQNQGCPNALLEALAAGLPVVANDDGGTAEQVINEKTGLLVADCRPQPLAQALLRILTDRQLASRLGSEGRAHVQQQFSMEAMASAYADMLVSAAEKSAVA